jgi:hypothetical protein
MQTMRRYIHTKGLELLLAQLSVLLISVYAVATVTRNDVSLQIIPLFHRKVDQPWHLAYAVGYFTCICGSLMICDVYIYGCASVLVYLCIYA